MTGALLSGGERAADFVLVDGGCYFGQSVREGQPTGDIRVLDVYDLPACDLSLHLCLVVDPFVDQELMYRERERIRAFLDSGKVLLFSGHLFRPWLPGAAAFVPKTIRSHHDYAVTIPEPRHPIFEGVQPDDLTFNRGVSGFFARGHHPLPPHAEALLTLPGGEPITYIDRSSTRGTIIVHSGNNLFGYGGSRSSSAGRIGGQLRSWVREEVVRIRERTAAL
ncbi:MAG: phosphate starvation-inducible protein PhoH [Paenibacillus sp.]|jgi:hypothetical protein|uniref:Phosphate starvation-inducible protein PhoH n=1 Tax=Paenibacillus hemerocallicola TaxID=1172614 RepID=A0A5C4T2E1_9BACL|nr:phosphate starvation-inducible protein PhoH [Paenibacillus hemerocallicola]MDF2661346.1 phosphate starvation-inducible protein PhoH [Paenibacillus sp.]TNJ63214.1 phosphate starvation-inducible protein PhoH [Paenibacillus hemerocallicola]